MRYPKPIREPAVFSRELNSSVPQSGAIAILRDLGLTQGAMNCAPTNRACFEKYGYLQEIVLYAGDLSLVRVSFTFLKSVGSHVCPNQ